VVEYYISLELGEFWVKANIGEDEPYTLIIIIEPPKQIIMEANRILFKW
jgi:hypothetical protein